MDPAAGSGRGCDRCDGGRKPILEKSTGDRFEDAVKKVRGETDSVTKKVEEAREREKTKMDRLNSLFEDGLKRAKDEGPASRPINPLDMD